MNPDDDMHELLNMIPFLKKWPLFDNLLRKFDDGINTKADLLVYMKLNGKIDQGQILVRPLRGR